MDLRQTGASRLSEEDLELGCLSFADVTSKSTGLTHATLLVTTVALSHVQDTLPLSHWQECSMLLECLLAYCKWVVAWEVNLCVHFYLLFPPLLRLHREDIETLFQLLKAFLYRHITSFPFLKLYLENTVAKDYTIEQKRALFFKFVEIFSQQEYTQELKAKVCVFCMWFIVLLTKLPFQVA